MSSDCKCAFCSLWNGTTFKISKNYMYTTTSTGNTCILPQPLKVYAYYHKCRSPCIPPQVSEVRVYYPKHWRCRYTNYYSHWKHMSTPTNTGRAFHPLSQRWVILTHFIFAQKHAICSEDFISVIPQSRDLRSYAKTPPTKVLQWIKCRVLITYFNMISCF